MRVGVDARRPRPAGDRLHRSPVAQAAHVVQHVPNQERRALAGRAVGAERLRRGVAGAGGVDRQLRHVFAHRVVERQLAVADEQKDRRGGELLGDRARFEDRVGLVRHVVFEVRHAVGALHHRSIVHRDAHRTARRGAGPPGEDRVEGRGRGRPCTLRRGPRDGRRQEEGDDGEARALRGGHGAPMIANFFAPALVQAYYQDCLGNETLWHTPPNRPTPCSTARSTR